MNNPNAHDSYWLEYSETLDENKEESVEIKEELFDDIEDIKQEDLIYYSSDIKYEIEDIKEDVEVFAEIKGEEPIIDGFNAIENESMEIKEDPIDNFVDIKEEEFSTLLIADVFCPSTGDSRSLTIDIDNEMHSRNVEQISPRRPTVMKATKWIKVNGSIRVTRDGVIKLERNGPPIRPLAPIEPISAPIAPNRAQDGSSIVSDCTICKVLRPNGPAMEKHARLMHPEWLLKNCSFCDERHFTGAAMENHLRSMHLEELKRFKEQMRLKNFAFSNSLYSIDSGMANQVRSIHHEEFEKTRGVTKCVFCDFFYKEGASMEKHVRRKHPEKCTMVKKISMKRGRRSKDEELAVANGLPISVAEIVDMSRAEIKQLLLETGSLTELQRELIRTIRKRGRNKLVQRESRQRRELARTEHVKDAGALD